MTTRFLAKQSTYLAKSVGNGIKQSTSKKLIRGKTDQAKRKQLAYGIRQ